jgi:hypothetical protein
MDAANWYQLPEPEITWLVEGLITSDGYAAICGKPKAGESTFIRAMIAAVIKGNDFLDRSIGVPAGTGRLLCIHLDRKDRPWRVAKELRDLDITEEESDRVILRTEEEMVKEPLRNVSPGYRRRSQLLNLIWLSSTLMWLFLIIKNSNEYNAVLDGINAPLHSPRYRASPPEA